MKEIASEQPKYGEQTKEELRRYLMHYPAEAGEPSREQMAEYARRLGQTISVKIEAKSMADGWYVVVPNRAPEKVATYEEYHQGNPPRNLYLVYHPNGDVRIGRGMLGVEFRTRPVSPPQH